MQLNAQAINVTLSTLSAEVQDEAIFNGQPPPESAHLIWTRLFDLYGKSKCDDAFEIESMESMSIVSSCSEEASQDLKSAEPEQEVQEAHDLLSACTGMPTRCVRYGRGSRVASSCLQRCSSPMATK